jgi:hypothetical protein
VGRPYLKMLMVVGNRVTVGGKYGGKSSKLKRKTAKNEANARVSDEISETLQCGVDVGSA